MKEFLIIDTNVCGRIRKNQNDSLLNFLKSFPEEKFTTIQTEFAYYEYLGLRAKPPIVDLKNIVSSAMLLLLPQEIDSFNKSDASYYSQTIKAKGIARLHYKNEITEDLIKNKFAECEKYMDASFKNTYVYNEIFETKPANSSIANNLAELLTSDFINSFTEYLDKNTLDIAIYTSFLGVAYEIAIEKRNVHLLRSLKRFWMARDLDLQAIGGVSEQTVEFIDKGVRRIKSRQDYFDLELISLFLMGFSLLGYEYPVTILTEDNKEETLSRIIAAFSFISQAKTEMNKLKQIGNVSFNFHSGCKYIFVNSSCQVIDSLTFADVIRYLEENKIILNDR